MKEVTAKEAGGVEMAESTSAPAADSAVAAESSAKQQLHDHMRGGWQKWKKSWKKDLKKNWPVYLLFLPVLAWLLIVHYVPMLGILLAWKDYNVWDGIWGSEWVGWANFETLFTGGGTGSLDFLYALRNTVMIGLLNLTFGFIAPIIFAFLVSSVRIRKYKRVCQMLSYLPKATVQAAIGGIALSEGLACGETVLSVAVAAIILTAPIGAAAIELSGKRLLLPAQCENGEKTNETCGRA